MVHLSLILLSLALSIDSCSVGFTYGLRNLRIPFKSILVIMFCSALVMFISMEIGLMLQNVFSPSFTKLLGGFILISMGIYIIVQYFLNSTDEIEDLENNIEKILFNLEIRSLGVVIHILHRPTKADLDKSGGINGLEALLLGFALSLDAFGAGIGASLLGYSPIILAIVTAVMSGSFLYFGFKMGATLSKWKWLQKCSFIPGIILIIIGLTKL